MRVTFVSDCGILLAGRCRVGTVATHAANVSEAAIYSTAIDILTFAIIGGGANTVKSRAQKLRL